MQNDLDVESTLDMDAGTMLVWNNRQADGLIAQTVEERKDFQ